MLYDRESATMFAPQGLFYFLRAVCESSSIGTQESGATFPCQFLSPNVHTSTMSALGAWFAYPDKQKSGAKVLTNERTSRYSTTSSARACKVRYLNTYC